MTNPTLILPRNTALAHHWVDAAPQGTVLTFKKPGRTIPQNKRMWSLLAEVSHQATHIGRKFSPEDWKCLFMHAFGHESRFMVGLSGEPFPVGFRSSKLSKDQMSELMEFISAWGAENGVRFSEPEE